MSKDEKLSAQEKRVGLISGMIDYENGSVKVWFRNGKKIVLPSADCIDEYIETHMEELL